MNSTEKIFVDGLGFHDPSEKAPEYILGKITVCPKRLLAWLEEHKDKVSEKGWLNIDVKRSKNTGDPYLELNTYKPDTATVVKQAVETQPTVESGDSEYPENNINPDDIPF